MSISLYKIVKISNFQHLNLLVIYLRHRIIIWCCFCASFVV